MTKKITDENGNVFVEVKPWYKKWWVWLIIVIVAFVFIGILGSGDDDDSSSSTGSGTAHQTTSKEKGKDTSTGKLTYEFDTLNYTDSKKYNLGYKDTSWNAASVTVNNITVYKLSKAYEGKYHGVIKLNLNVKTNRDIDIYPTQGTLVVNGEQHEDTPENWDGEISKGVTKSGNVMFLVKSLKSVKDVKQLRYKFDGDYDTDDYDDDNSNHTYDMTLNLN